MSSAVLRWSRGMAAVLAMGALAACSASGSGSAAGALAQRAHELYDLGEFRKSHELLRQVVRQSGPDAELLYNLGCALYRDGRLGEAIAAWESARLLDPRDADLLHNLEVASAQKVDRLPEIERSVLERFLDGIAGNLSLDEWSVVLYAVYLLFVAGLAVRISIRSARRRDHWATVMFGICVLLGVCGVLYGWAWAEYHRPRAVVTASEVGLHSGPDGSGEKVATLHAGLVVEVTGAAGQDRQIRLATGWQGYVPSEALQGIGLEDW
jgi:hypothetical protein